jgi:hypothetical protein
VTTRLPPTRMPLLLLLTGSAVAASASSAPVLTLALMKVMKASDGHESFALAERVRPGETLLQQAVLKSQVALKGGHIVVPVPANTRYQPGSATSVVGLSTDFSADSGKTFSEVPMRAVKVEVTGADGKVSTVLRQVPVPQNEYTTVRWTVHALPAASVTTVSFRVLVN